jgi:hypothetical protein
VEEGGNKIVRNVGTYISNYTASHPRENPRPHRLNVLEKKYRGEYLYIRKKRGQKIGENKIA